MGKGEKTGLTEGEADVWWGFTGTSGAGKACHEAVEWVRAAPCCPALSCELSGRKVRWFFLAEGSSQGGFR